MPGWVWTPKPVTPLQDSLYLFNKLQPYENTVNYKWQSRRRFFLLMRSRTPPISSEFFWGGVWTPQTPPLGTPLVVSHHYWYLHRLNTMNSMEEVTKNVMTHKADSIVVACVAVKCDHVLCPVQFLFLQKITDFKEQCICIKLFQIGKIVAETFQMLTFAFGEEAMKQTVVFYCSAESGNGMTSVKDAEYSLCLPTGRMYRNVEHMCGIWHESRCITVHMEHPCSHSCACLLAECTEMWNICMGFGMKVDVLLSTWNTPAPTHRIFKKFVNMSV